MLLRETVGVGFDDHVVEPVLRAERFQALWRILGEQIHFTLLHRDMVDALCRDRAHDIFKVV